MRNSCYYTIEAKRKKSFVILVVFQAWYINLLFFRKIPVKFASVLCFVCLIMGTSCQKIVLNVNYQNTPLGNFDALWDEYNQTYGAFEAKGINWDSLRNVYRSQITNKTNNDELHAILCKLLAHLNDGHVQLIAPGYQRFFSSGLRTLYPDSKYYENGAVINDLFKLISQSYLQSDVKTEKNFFYGFIKSNKTEKSIGYLYVGTFNAEYFNMGFIDEALSEFKNSDGIILDLRFNGGGSTETFLGLLNRFADQKRMYLQSRLRNGPNQSDFTQLYQHYTEPKYGIFLEKPVVLLVNRFSGSSSEHFMIGMKTFPYVTVVGDTTYGALSTVIQKVLPNGWEFRSCPQVLHSLNGDYLRDSRGRYPDGVGLAPDIYVVNYYRHILSGYDYVLQKAIDIVNAEKNFQH